MPQYVWTGRTRQGTLQNGRVDARTQEEALSLLRRQNILVTSLRQRSSDLTLSLSERRVSDKDLVVFTRQFATMINAGLPLVQCLDILANQTENTRFAKAISEVRGEVEAGRTYSEALKKYPTIFDELYISMVTAGEAGGILDTILGRLAKHIEKAMKLKKQIKGAMVYPVTIVGVAVTVIVVLMVWVIPIFAQMFTDFGGDLPLPTQLVIQASAFMKQNFLYLLGGVIALGVGLKRLYAHPRGRRVIDTCALKLPIFGDLIQKSSVAKFSRTLGTLISSGVPILDGMSIVAKTTGNTIIEEALLSVKQSVSEGKTIAEPLGKTKVFPPMVIQMISVGEATGSLDTMLSKIADFYDDEVDAAVTALTSLLEPMLMVFLGVTIGFIVTAMYLPIFKMASLVG